MDLLPLDVALGAWEVLASVHVHSVFSQSLNHQGQVLVEEDLLHSSVVVGVHELEVDFNGLVFHDLHNLSFVVGFLDVLVKCLLVFEAWSDLF